jgi:sulfur-oxidizing protein SoxY
MPTRREMLNAGAAFAGVSLFNLRLARAATQLEDAIREKTGGAPLEKGRITLGIPQVAENGLSVFTTVAVESPMTPQDHVRAIHLFSEKNPIAHIVTFRIGPRAGHARISTNIRLAASQRVTAIAEMSDGRFFADERGVVVTIAACIDGG